MSASLMKLSAFAGFRPMGDLLTSRFSSLSGVVPPQGGASFGPGDFPFLRGFFMLDGLLSVPADTQQFENFLVCFLETAALERRKQLHREWQRTTLFVNIT